MLVRHDGLSEVDGGAPFVDGEIDEIGAGGKEDDNEEPWTGSELQKWFKERGIHHADDMSGIILTSFHRRFYRKEIELEEQIAKYQEYWDEVDPDVNKGLM